MMCVCVLPIRSILHFLHPSLFNDSHEFINTFHALTAPPASLSSSSASAARAEALASMHRLMSLFMLRRLKNEVCLDLPDKREIILRSDMTALQKKIYRSILMKNLSALQTTNSRVLVNIIQALRKASSHPYLIPGTEPEPFIEGPHLHTCSGKFYLLQRILHLLAMQRPQRKILIFSTSTQTLDIVQDVLNYLHYSYERLDGSTRAEERYEAVHQFQHNLDTFIFLLSTRAGGVGLNLTQASVIIFIDADWNPMMDVLAQHILLCQHIYVPMYSCV